jgi:hypothetical protein
VELKSQLIDCLPCLAWRLDATPRMTEFAGSCLSGVKHGETG